MDKESKNMARSEHNVTRRGFVGAAAATAATVAGLGLAGCGGGGETTTDSGSASTDSNVEIIEADEEGFVVRAEKTDGKAPKNECILAFEGEFQEMHPMDWSDGNSGNVVYYIYDSLYDLDENYEPSRVPLSPTRSPTTPAPIPSTCARASPSPTARRSTPTRS